MPDFKNSLTLNGAGVALIGHTHDIIVSMPPWDNRPITAAAWASVLSVPTGTYSIVGIHVALYVFTTNNASNYWILQLMRDTTVIWTGNTAALAAATHTAIHYTTPFAATVVDKFVLAVSKSGSPGNIYANCSLVLRFT
jgi:hypothetical protein